MIPGPFKWLTAGGGALAGGAAGAFGAANLADVATTAYPQPDTPLSDAQHQIDQRDFPLQSRVGDFIPQGFFFTPGWAGVKMAATGAGLAGSIEAANEYWNNGQVDPIRVGEQTAVGAFLNRPTTAGEWLGAAGAWARAES